MDFEIVSLKSKLDSIGDNEASLELLREALKLFKCTKNSDEEDFLHNKAIDFEIHNKARTYLLVDNNKVIAYFSLAFKSIDLSEVSGELKKDITAGNKSVTTYSAYLIGHIAKADTVKARLGYALLDSAIDLILDAQKIVGGRLVYLDCKNNEKLISFYSNYGFKHFKTSPFGLEQFYKRI